MYLFLGTNLLLLAIFICGLTQIQIVVLTCFWFMFFFNPFLTFGLALFLMVGNVRLGPDDGYIQLVPGINLDAWTSNYVLVGQGFLYGCINLLLDFLRNDRFRRTRGDMGWTGPQVEQQEDVHHHAEEVEMDIDGDFLIKSLKLVKTYEETKLQAVCGNTFGVKTGEVFGLLGANGAGKSTTMDVMAMQTSKTRGEARLLNKNVDRIDLGKFGKMIGFCP